MDSFNKFLLISTRLCTLMLGTHKMGDLVTGKGRLERRAATGTDHGGEHSCMSFKQHRETDVIALTGFTASNLVGLCAVFLLWSGGNIITPVTCYVSCYTSSVSDFYHWSG